MNQGFVAKTTIVIDTPTSKVWDALTQPDLIKQYLFGTHVTTDWQVGSPITYTGIWEGKPYEDKGQILQVEPGKFMVSTFWSALSGRPDTPANYNTVSYEMTAEGSGARLTIIQDNNISQEEADHSERNWMLVLEGLKRLLEG